MVDGLWTIRFEAMGNPGGGVAVLLKGQVLGGDSGFTYTGKYQESGSTIKATVNVNNFVPGIPNVMGLNTYSLELNGNVSGDAIQGKATSPARPGVTLTVSMARIVKLT